MSLTLHLSSLLITTMIIGCNKSNSKSEPTPVQVTLSQTHESSETEDILELSSLAGKHETGDLIIRYKGAGSELKKWTIHSPLDIAVSKEYIEIHFKGSYFIDDIQTKPGKKRLFIKKEDINMIFLTE